MKLTYVKYDNIKKFSELELGEVFDFYGSVLMKTEVGMIKESKINAVELETGEFFYLKDDTVVPVLECTLHIKGELSR